MRTKLIVPSILLGALLILAPACSKPKLVKTPESAKTDTSAADAAKTAEARRQAEEAARKQAEEAARKRAEEEAAQEATRQMAFKHAAEQALQDVHFDFDRADILEKEKPLLQNVADFLKTYSIVRIQIQGNCDERGTTEYNLSLGERRATAVMDYLKSLGADPSRMEILSYGKEKPICEEHLESCWYKNRRAHFLLK